MQLEIPDNALVFFCGGNPVKTKPDEVHEAVKSYFYGDPDHIADREAGMAAVLFRYFKHQLQNMP